jgi:outer membrane biosynthesis protein TonB
LRSGAIRAIRAREKVSLVREDSMRKLLTAALALGAIACGTKQEQSASIDADLQKDLASVGASDSGLALASADYQPMRFVSSVEQVKPAVPSKRVSHTSEPAKAPKPRPKAKRAPAPAPTPEPQVVAEADVPEPEPQQTPSEAPAPEPQPVVIAQQPSPEPSHAPVGNTGDGGVGNRGNGGGWGGILGGIIGAVVIRGGMGGVDHCDPRTDGRVRPTYPNVPIARQPRVNTGGVFGGHRH